MRLQICLVRALPPINNPVHHDTYLPTYLMIFLPSAVALISTAASSQPGLESRPGTKPATIPGAATFCRRRVSQGQSSPSPRRAVLGAAQPQVAP